MSESIRHSLRMAFCICVLAAIAFLSGCASMGSWQNRRTLFGPDPMQDPWTVPEKGGAGATNAAYRTPEQIQAPLTGQERAVIASAETLLGQKPNAVVTVKGRAFTLDCIGTVSAIYYGIGVDVQADFRRYPGDGVNRLFLSLRALNVLHQDRYPRPGDIVFWDNTWDANGDGNLNDDPRTHAGIVLSVDADGTIHYVHEHVVRGVIVEAMNLLHPRDYYGPDRKVINNALAMNSGISRHDNPPRWVSGDLFDSFGDILRVRGHFAVVDVGAPAVSVMAMRDSEPTQ